MSGDGAWKHTVINRLAAELTRTQYEVWLLRAHGRTFQQIGDILGITKQAAHGHHARAQLRARLIADQEDSRDRTPE